MGLQDGDAPFYARPGLEDPWPNWYWYEAGNNRTRYTLASRFKHMLGEDFIDSNGNGVWDSTESFTDCAIVGADVGAFSFTYGEEDESGFDYMEVSTGTEVGAVSLGVTLGGNSDGNDYLTLDMSTGIDL